MKKSIIKNAVMFIIVGFLASSCASSAKTFSINRVRHAEPRLQESIPLEAFTILGSVSGEGNVKGDAKSQGKKMSLFASIERFEGDTGLYGSLDWDDAIYLNMPVGYTSAPKTPFEAALGNAVYQMIEAAEALEADVILFVRTKTNVTQTNNVQEVKVKVRGVAAKLKNTSSSKRSTLEAQ